MFIGYFPDSLSQTMSVGCNVSREIGRTVSFQKFNLEGGSGRPGPGTAHECQASTVASPAQGSVVVDPQRRLAAKNINLEKWLQALESFTGHFEVQKSNDPGIRDPDIEI